MKIFQKILGNFLLMLFVLILISTIHIFYHFKYPDLELIQRTGGIATLIGVIMVFRKRILAGLKNSVKSEYIIDGGSASTNWEAIAREAKKNIISEYVGTFVILIGTIIWCYGDLLF